MQHNRLNLHRPRPLRKLTDYELATSMAARQDPGILEKVVTGVVNIIDGVINFF